MELKVKSITLYCDGVLKVETNISDNLELAKHVNKFQMEKCLNTYPLEMHVYQTEGMISSIAYEGEIINFQAKDFMEYLKTIKQS